MSEHPPPPVSAPPDAIYAARCADFAARRDGYQQRWSTLANVRLALIAAALACFGLGVWRGVWWLHLVAAVLLGGFAVAVARHRRLARLRDRFAALWAINDEGLKRLRRDWATLPLRTPPHPPPDHPLATDLGLLGHASLQHLLNTAYTPVGQATLQRWLLHGALPAVVRARQAAVAELAPHIDFRDELALRSRGLAGQQADYEAFLSWAESQPWLPSRPWLHSVACLLPVVTLTTLLAWLAGLIDYPLWAVSILASMGLTFALSGQVDAVLDRVSARQRVFRVFADVFHVLRTTPFDAPHLRQLQAAFSSADVTAEVAMQQLQRIISLADLRMWLLYPVLQWLTLWNVHVLWLLERWQRRTG
ncbi:MAG: hypothetical protein M3380_19295, partial [Chloroflexota bacterium]|nr:hypothetical protein [Chloroflexota bacterium]